MSLLVIRCADYRCHRAVAINTPNEEWRQLVSILLDDGWVLTEHEHPQRTLVTRSVSAGLGRQRLRCESMLTIYACCPHCHEKQLTQNA